MHSNSYSESDYFVDKSDISDDEGLHDYLLEDENGGGEPDSCNVQPYLFETEVSAIEDKSTDSLVTAAEPIDFQIFLGKLSGPNGFIFMLIKSHYSNFGFHSLYLYSDMASRSVARWT